MADKDFEIGTTVRLKSGGPVMTVDTIKQSDGRYFCVWFDGKKRLREAFQAATLEEDDNRIMFGVV